MAKTPKQHVQGMKGQKHWDEDKRLKRKTAEDV
jgi:hypothetical protein